MSELGGHRGCRNLRPGVSTAGEQDPSNIIGLPQEERFHRPDAMHGPARCCLPGTDSVMTRPILGLPFRTWEASQWILRHGSCANYRERSPA